MKYVYLHGFNSGKNSRSARMLSETLNVEVICPEYDYSKTFQECLVSLEDQINLLFAKEICVMGTSLGGFMALSLRHASIKEVIAWNPVIYPALELMRFLGPNTRFSDGSQWILDKDIALSYSRSADPRVWKNFYWDSLKIQPQFTPRRTVLFGKHDTLLDSDLGIAYWQGFANVHVLEEDHRIENFDHIKDILAHPA